MKAIPLIQKADVQSINTSIIALKEAQKELETLNIQVNRKISDLNKLLDGLDVSEIGGSGKLIQSIKQTDGKISATSVDLTSTIASGNNQPATSGGVADYIVSQKQGGGITDCNQATRNGIWYFHDAINCPPASLGFTAPDKSGSLYVQAFDSSWINQICQDFYSDGFIFIRSCKGGNWTNWRRVSVINDFGTWETVWEEPNTTNIIKGVKTPLGTFLRIRFAGNVNGYGYGNYIQNGTVLLTLPEGWRPTVYNPNRCVLGVDTTQYRCNAGLDIASDGTITIYFHGNTPLNGGEYVIGFFCDLFMNIL